MGLKASVALACKRLVQGYRATSESYVEHLKKIGVAVGEDCVIFTPGRTNIETLNPHLLTIGDHVAMTGPVTILTHDYSVGVTKIWTHGEVLGSQKPVTIGNNVFLGWGCTVLAGTTIGDNCVIGAGSVVSGRVEGNSIWGGFLLRRYAAWSITTSDAKRSKWRKPLPSTVATRGASTWCRRKRCFMSTSICSPQAPTICAAHFSGSLRTTATSMNALHGLTPMPQSSIPMRISVNTQRSRLAVRYR